MGWSCGAGGSPGIGVKSVRGSFDVALAMHGRPGEFGIRIAVLETEENAMTTVLDGSKVAKSPEVESACSATCLAKEVKEAIQRLEKDVNELQAAVSEEIDDGKVAAARLLNRGRYALEDGVSEAVHTIKRYPVSSIAIGFAAGAALAFLLPRFGKK